MRITEIFKGDKGEFSSKRFVGILGALVLCGSMVYYHSDKLIEAVEFITNELLTIILEKIDKHKVNEKLK